eukprot:TRINITY_DN2436_c0_g1_i2.p1 TRINITY_DN2436_c0_g1~~TRINITY_DN2436_c0_g1_i2.p1  ORF type:complete len:170 (-),score=44.56 TRINITY_DN2436_c0_g1_i2:30-539(-)
MIIGLIICGIVILLDIDYMETRFATASGGLLAQVFLQLSFTGGQLPRSLDYLTLLDWLFNVSYVLILAIIVECIVIQRYFSYLVVSLDSVEHDLELRGHDSISAINLGTKGKKFESPDEEQEYLRKKAANLKKRKQQAKIRVRKVERIFFLAYLGCLFVMFLVITLALR